MGVLGLVLMMVLILGIGMRGLIGAWGRSPHINIPV